MDSMDDDTIIGEIKKRPCLWDTHDLHYKDREKKRNAWIQVTKAVLGSKFTKITDEEKNEIGTEVQKRWKALKESNVKEWKDNDPKRKRSAPPVRHPRAAKERRAEKDESNDQDDSQDHEGSGDDVSADDTPKGAMAGRGRKSQAQAQPKPTPTMTKTPRRVPGNDDFERQLWELFQESVQAEANGEQPGNAPDPVEMFLLSQLPIIRTLGPVDKVDFQRKLVTLVKSYATREEVQLGNVAVYL